MRAIEFKVGYYDQFYDIPLRGMIEDRAAWLPFVAEVHQNASDEKWATGIPAKLHVFPANDRLAPMFRAITESFHAWQAKFRRGGAAEASHPATSDPDFKRTAALIDEAFRCLHGNSREIRGFFSVRDGVWWLRVDTNEGS